MMPFASLLSPSRTVSWPQLSRLRAVFISRLSVALPPAISPMAVASARPRSKASHACVFIPADLEPAKVLNTAVYGARIVRINGNYDHVNRPLRANRGPLPVGASSTLICAPIIPRARKRMATKLPNSSAGHCPNNVVVPMAGGSLITKIAKAFPRIGYPGLGSKPSP